MELCLGSLSRLVQYAIPQGIAEINAIIKDLKDLRGSHDQNIPI